MNDLYDQYELQAPFFKELSSQQFPFGLGSDNHSGTHPRILKTLERVNSGFAPSYGTDVVTEHAVRVFKSHFGPDIDVHFCFNGTAANVLALAPLVRSFQAVVCSDVAHVNVDECGAPEKHLGAKLIPIPTKDGKLTPESIEPFLIRRGDQHFSQISAVSTTQPTEFVTVNTKTQITPPSQFFKKNDLWLHIDGARFINSAAALACTLREAADGADVLSFGGTKNGLMFGEAVLFLSQRARLSAKDFPFVRKQLMQLPSKTRFIAAQFIELLETDLWKEIAMNSIARASELRRGLENNRLVKITQKTEANAVFAIFERGLEKAIKKSAFFYVWNEETRECRLMTSWSTTSADISRVLKIANEYASTTP
jgi:threonine aldolase